MKFFWRYIFPALYGLLIYITIRLVTDSGTGENFWHRDWRKNGIEIGVVVVMGYVVDLILRRYIGNQQRLQARTDFPHLLGEISQLVLIGFLIANPILFFIHFLIHDPVKLFDFVIANVVVVLYLLLYYAITRGNNLIHAYIAQRLQMEKIRSDQLATELKFLKAQYHPHFLFNALNTIYFQMDDNVPAAKKSIEKFSELLRYQLYDQQQMVPISQEMDYLRNFIDLQQLRSSDKLSLSLELDPRLDGQLLYPLLLLPLVENAFKYVGGDYQLSIRAILESGRLLFQVINSVPPTAHPPREHGIGLENLRRRLELLYPGQYELATGISGSQFIATLNLELSSHA